MATLYTFHLIDVTSTCTKTVDQKRTEFIKVRSQKQISQNILGVLRKFSQKFEKRFVCAAGSNPQRSPISKCKKASDLLLSFV
ncbi:hypothetical protein B9Z55_014436 [Caenorhabditis nigoni]|uniref:Uncharacterized protein n=1 Tax=Caenorhabditis nigoni TaxID=1611254 RepID=A0A2G5U5V5_9PELO|nr:hypothetical protein B9Z55_014436 [Caenorhabditis nigoni]